MTTPRFQGAYDVALIRTTYPRAYRKWSTAEDELLVRLWECSPDIDGIAATLGRNPGGIASRLKRLQGDIRLPTDVPSIYDEFGRFDREPYRA